MFILFFLFRFIILLIVYNSFSDSVTSSIISASLLRGVLPVGHYWPTLRVLNLNCLCLSYEPESLEALSFLLFCVLKTAFTALVTSAFSSLPSAGRFLAHWNLTRPATPPQVFDQVYFMAFAFARMTLHKFISWPGTCRGHTGEFFFLVLFLIVLFSEGLAAW